MNKWAKLMKISDAKLWSLRHMLWPFGCKIFILQLFF